MRPGRDLADINSGDSFQASELQDRPRRNRAGSTDLSVDIAHIGHAKTLDDRNAFLLHPAFVISFRPRPRRADLDDFRIHTLSICF